MAYIGNNLDSDIQVNKYEYTATAGQTIFACTYDRAVDVYVNGVKLDSSDFTATNGTSITLASGANVGDIVDINAYFDVTYANFYTQDEADARFMDINEETLPDQSGQSGKFLTTDGSNSSWGTVDLTDLNPTQLTIPNYASAPSSPSVGDVYYDTIKKVISHWDGTTWIQMSNKFDAEGGTTSSYSVAGVTYKVHTFTSSGAFTPNTSGQVDVVIVGGGGGGAGGFSNDASGGGGGAGAVRVSSGVSVNPQTYDIIIGAGGAAGNGGASPSGAAGRTSPTFRDGQYGVDSSAIGMVANGGGGGATFEDTPGFTNGNASAGGNGGAGGCQGGACSTYNTGGVYGNRGGLEAGDGQSNDSTSCGGGGGAGGVGGNGTNRSTAGSGGVGLQNEYQTGSIQYYGGGGGGGSVQGSQAPGGLGGGGAGGTPTGPSGGNNGVSGSANTGGGGGGASSGNINVNGGAGGSGIVIIRYPI